MKLLIVGAGGFGREVLQWAEDAAPTHGWTVAGFLDDRADALAGFEISTPIVGAPGNRTPQPDELFLCAIGDPEARLRVAADLEARGAKFATLIHPTAVVGARSQVGAGSILCPYAVVTTDVVLGRHVVINAHSVIGHDAVLGDGCSLMVHCDVAGGCQLGTGVFMGTHAVVVPKVIVDDFARIGAGSVVVRRVKARTTVMGVPARRLDFTPPEDPPDAT